MLILSLIMKKIINLILLSLFGFNIFLNCQSVNHWETAVYNNDIWKYLIGISEPGPDWRLLTFNDTTWSLGPGENILAVQVHNSTATSSDMTSNVFLSFGITNNSSDYRPVPSWFSPLVVFTSSNLPKVLRLPATKAIRF